MANVATNMTEKLKYKDEIEKLEPDFSGFYEKKCIAYRWTFEDINDAKNFQPAYLLSPNRRRTTFKGWGLSFFDSQLSARERIQELTKNKKMLFKKLGTHVAEGKLVENDGLSNEPETNGHFTHFEYTGAVLKQKFEIIGKLT